MSFTNKVALITGGAKGIGFAAASVFIRNSAKVVIVDVDEKAGRAAQRELGENCLFIKGDVSHAEEVKETVDIVVGKWGGIDFLVNNAGIIRYATAYTCTEDEWDEVMNVNLKSAFLCSRYALPSLVKNKGVVINVASAQAFISSSNMVHYTTAKSALLGFTRSLAIDFAPHVRAIAVCPGTIDTPMARNAWNSSQDPKQIEDESVNMHLLKRIGKPEEVGELIVALCGDKFSFITGQAIRIDGGLGINVPGSVGFQENGEDLNAFFK